MKKSKQLVIAMLSVLAVSVSLGTMYPQADAQGIPETASWDQTISVTGMATTSVEPDLLIVRLGVETQEYTAKQALAENSAMMKKAISSLKQLGITEKEISTSSLDIYPVYEYVKDEFLGTQTRELVGYKVSNILSVETANLSLAANIIDGSVNAGINKIESVSYSLSTQRHLELKDNLLANAIEDAKSKAGKALAPLDYDIVGVKSISLSEFAMPYPQPMFKAAFGESYDSQTSVFASDQDVTTSVQVVFLIGSN